jgi:acyl-CoA reductase-like NAD-dependent aldehyde dehydrogenase
MAAGIDWIDRARRVRPQISNFVDGRRQRQSDGALIDKFGPRDGQLVCRFAGGEARDVDNAVASARVAFADGRWSTLNVQRRKECLYRLAALIESHAEEFALLESLDVGKPINDALACDVPHAAATIRFCAEAADKLPATVYAVEPRNLSFQLRRPMGVVAGIVGWNFPLLLAAAKIGPALATGNCLVLKPSELTSLSTVRLAELAVEAGIPEGVLNVVHGGREIGAQLASHRGIDLISFTGSSATGKQVMIASGQSNMKRLILECGGKAPNVVFDDAPDLESVANAVVNSAFRNQGEVCVASSRVLVQAGIKKDLLQAIVQRTAELRLGDPLRTETQFGALVSQGHKQKVLGYIERGERDGARVIYRSNSPAPYDSGFYVGPVILDNVKTEHCVAQEEIFGPVLSVLTFKDEEEAVRIANDTVYGLSAIVWTTDLGRALRVTHSINAGWVVVNATGKAAGGPGAGVLSVGGHKESGVGAEGGIAGLQAYMSDTAVQYFT